MKKSQSLSKKLNKFKASPLIMAVAILEVIILICASTFAWFVFAENNTVSSDAITVEPDSGLEIDFNDADSEDFVNIWNYIDEFTFEPVTSLDGRNLFVPTTGTFNSVDTTAMTFREATVNDMNSKYINIDFTLTNTGEEEMKVYLSAQSSFKFDNHSSGKALRLAFYKNDGSIGQVSSSLLSTSNANQTTVYFYNTHGWEQPYAHIWKDDIDDSKDKSLKPWPGTPMTRISGNVYYYTFNSMYDSIIFNDGTGEYNAEQSVDISPSETSAAQDGYIYMLTDLVENSKNEYNFSVSDYASTVAGGTYPVISPGVSPGFQRAYAPVTELNNTTGSATTIVPAFASSIDDYNFGSKELFTIDANETMSLSMIVWLEGTDPDCKGETYAGKDIDMNLIFATQSAGDDTYKYIFRDKTKETWIDSQITTETGVKFDPVIQLYDAENEKGYLMRETDWITDKDGKKVAIEWSVDAPQELMNCDNIIFRRVNPMDEDEVWNYWDTNGFGSISGTVVNSTVTFSAFADGAPTHAAPDKDSGNVSNAPARSCGGLWGDYEMQMITVLDATNGKWIGTSDNDDKYDGTLTINFTLNGQTIEYKGSGSGTGMYYFVVPKQIMLAANDSRPSISFKRYYNYNPKYAINSLEKQPDIRYHKTWNAGTCLGHFFSINQTHGGADNIYWGDDIIYIQNESALKGILDDSSSQWQVRFYSDSTGSDSSGTSKYAYMYKNSNYSADKNTYGYPVVIPSNHKYHFYRVERVSASDTSARWNRTPLIPITVGSTDYAYNSNTVEKNICKLTHLEHTIFFQIEAAGASPDNNNPPKIYTYNDNGDNNGWNKEKMEYVSTVGGGGIYKYKSVVNVTKYNHMQFTIDLCEDSIYLKIQNGWWKDANAWFAAYFYNNSTGKNAWARTTYLSDDMYRAVVPSGTWEGVIWVRMNPYYSDLTWGNDKVWNQTVDLTFPSGDNRVFYLTGDQTGSWGKYTGGDSGTDVYKSNVLDIGTSGNKNAEIYNGVIESKAIAVTKLDIIEDGYDESESIAFTLYNSPDWP